MKGWGGVISWIVNYAFLNGVNVLNTIIFHANEDTGHEFLWLVGPIQNTRGPPSTENQHGLRQWHTKRNPQHLITTNASSWYYKSILSPIPVPTTSYSYTGSRGSKSQTNTIIISVPIRHWLGILSVNTSCNGSPDLTPLYSCLRAACKKLMQQDLAIVFRYSYRSIGQTYSCLGGQTRG